MKAELHEQRLLDAIGLSTAANADRTDSYDSDCSYGFGHLYCLQDLPLVFADDFESGGTGVWSVAVP